MLAGMLSDADRALLGTLPLIAELHELERQALETELSLESYSDHARIIESGGPPERCFFLLQGELIVSRNNIVVANLQPPDLIGFIGIADDEPRTATVDARGEVRVAALDRAPYERLLRAQPGFARAMIRHLARTVRMLYRNGGVH